MVTLKLQRHDELLDIIISHCDMIFDKTSDDFEDIQAKLCIFEEQSEDYHKRCEAIDERMDEFCEKFITIKKEQAAIVKRLTTVETKQEEHDERWTKRDTEYASLRENVTALQEDVRLLLLQQQPLQQQSNDTSQDGVHSVDTSPEKNAPGTVKVVDDDSVQSAQQPPQQQVEGIDENAQGAIEIADNGDGNMPGVFALDDDGKVPLAANFGKALSFDYTPEDSRLVASTISEASTNKEGFYLVHNHVFLQSFKTLRAGIWLSDELINYFFVLLGNRDESLCKANSPGDVRRKRCHFFSSFLMTKLLNMGKKSNAMTCEYEQVKRWGDKVFARYDKVSIVGSPTVLFCT